MIKLFASIFVITMILMPQEVSAAGISGKIISVSPSQEAGWTEIRVQTSRGEQVFFIHQQTLIAGIVPAKKLKKGSSIFVTRPAGNASAGSGGGFKGFKSPFSNIPPNLRKKMNLPEIPGVAGVPEIPSAKTNLPQIPKSEVPKTPQVPQVPDPRKSQKTSAPREAEPSEEEKSLFGRVDSNKPLLPGTRLDVSEIEKKEVVDVDNTKDGVRIRLKNSNGQTEEQILSPENTVLEQLRISDLKSQMSVDLDVREDQAVAKVTVIE